MMVLGIKVFLKDVIFKGEKSFEVGVFLVFIVVDVKYYLVLLNIFSRMIFKIVC